MVYYSYASEDGIINGTDIYLQDTWSKVLELFKKSNLVEGLVFDTYFKDSRIFTLTDSICTIVVSNFIQVQVLSNYLNTLSGLLTEVINVPVACQVVLQNDLARLGKKDEPAPAEHPASLMRSGLYINPEYTFENFIVGPSNAEPHAAALAASCNPGKFYNPLFIYGDSGLGKTHLLQAIANYITEKNPELKLVVMTGSDFVDGVYKHQSDLDY